MDKCQNMEKNQLTKWHDAYIKNAYKELENGTTQKQLDVFNISVTGKKVLDVGCGPGNHLIALSRDNPQILIGVDMDELFLTVGRSKFEKHIIPPSTVPTLFRAVLPSLPFADNTFDLVTCFLVMPHVPDDKIALTELARVLKPGGTLAISGHGYGFPLRYLKNFRLKPLQMFLASFIYRCTGKKLVRNTLQNHKKICRTISSIGLTVETQHYKKGMFGCVSTYWVGATKRATIPKATQ